MNPETFLADIDTTTAQRAYDGVSHFPERRGETSRKDYANTLAADYAALEETAKRGGTLDLLPAEFARFRAGMRKRTLAYLASSARCVSSFIAGPSGFPAARMNKRADIAHRRLNELMEFRARGMAAIRRTLRPDLRPIYASDGDAIERLEADLSKAEALQERMKQTNASIRRHAKDGTEAQVAALLGMGYQLGQAHRLLERDFCGRTGFPGFELTNNGAKIRRMKSRVEHITRLQATPETTIEGTAARIEDCPPDNRVRLFFPGKPDEPTRTRLKRNGFRWTPSLGCWQAYRNHHSMETAKAIAAAA